jgi:hypothetical protein
VSGRILVDLQERMIKLSERDRAFRQCSSVRVADHQRIFLCRPIRAANIALQIVGVSFDQRCLRGEQLRAQRVVRRALRLFPAADNDRSSLFLKSRQQRIE